ncbi:MAG: glutamyl-tRNA amidotransferase [Gammaproteobacteria bacterium RIFCSPLOWO2_02_FULL_56_15]|nr:MAG: glutamyl-tRNA amidotransferase [Gammaproteobacteria bacterium RIFCSPLOWO2_02_FULL_56_15]
MSALKQRISDDVKQAMRERDKERLSTLRLLTAAIKQKEVDDRLELDDGHILALLDKLIRQYSDSIEQFKKGNRYDLVEKETRELQIVLHYLPTQMTRDEIASLVADTIDETSATSIRDMGKVMGALKPRVQGRADMSIVSELLKQQLSP